MKKISIAILLIIITLATAGYFYFQRSKNESHLSKTPIATVTATSTPSGVMSSEISVNGVEFKVPPQFGLATAPEQVLVKASVPPCDQDFDYCLYFKDSTYTNTNFDSAGVRIKKRDDLRDENSCLTTQPTGYSRLTPDEIDAYNFSTSVFDSLNDAGAGHFSEGAVYRLFFDTTCYEFQTRIATTNIHNYPDGSKEEFTQENKTSVVQSLQSFLSSVRLVSSPNEPVWKF